MDFGAGGLNDTIRIDTTLCPALVCLVLFQLPLFRGQESVKNCTFCVSPSPENYSAKSDQFDLPQ
jgi:hypothetical protein